MSCEKVETISAKVWPGKPTKDDVVVQAPFNAEAALIAMNAKNLQLLDLCDPIPWFLTSGKLLVMC